MEEYIKEDQVVKDEIYNLFKETIICPICKNILINPVICMQCQNVYCKKCTEDWAKKDNKCPNRCVNPKYQPSLGKNDILNKLKFKCKKCNKSVFYENMKKHIDSNCEKHVEIETPMSANKNTDNQNQVKKPKLEKMNTIQVEELKKLGKKITYLTGK